MSHLVIFQTIKQVKMHLVRVIAMMLMLLGLALTYLFLYEDNLSSFMKLGFNIWHFLHITYYFVRLVMMVDNKNSTLDEENEDDEPLNMIAYRLVIQDLMQQLQDQQEFQHRMNG